MPEFRRGMHLIFDGYKVSGELQRDLSGIVRWLDALPGKIGMRTLRKAEASGDFPPDCAPIDSGISAVVLLAESHATVHCWPERGELQFDLYSCKSFSPRTVVEDIVSSFGVGDWEVQLVPRRRRF